MAGERNILDDLDWRRNQRVRDVLGYASGRDPQQEAAREKLARQLGIAPASFVLTPEFQRIAAERTNAATLANAPRTRDFLLGDPQNAAVSGDIIPRLVGLEAMARRMDRSQRDALKDDIRRTLNYVKTDRGDAEIDFAADGSVMLLGRDFIGRADDKTGFFKFVRPVWTRPPDSSAAPVGTPGARLDALRGPEANPWTVARGLGSSFVTGLRRARAGIWAIGEDIVGEKDPRSASRREYARAELEDAMYTPEFQRGWQRMAYGGVASTLRAAPSVGAAVLTRNPMVAVGAMAGQTGLEAYPKYRERGAEPWEAALGAGGEGAVEGLTELLPMGFLVSRLGKSALAQFLGGLLLRELPTEQVATLAQDAIDTAIANPDKTWGEYFAERPSAALETAVSTGVQSLLFGGASAITRQFGRDDAAAAAAERNNQQFQRLLDDVGDNPLLERSPERLKAFLDTAAAGQEVYIPAEAMQDHLRSLEDDGARERFLSDAGIAEQMGPALAAGADIVMPVSTYAVAVGAKGHASLAKAVRLGLGSLSLREAEFLRQARESDGDVVGHEALTLLEADERRSDGGDRVERDVFSQFRAAGSTVDAASQYAAMFRARYETRASRLGVDPWEAYRRTGLKAVGELGPDLKAVLDRPHRLELVIDALRQGDRPQTRRGPSLAAFLAGHGGVKDEGGRLTAMDAHLWRGGKASARRLVSENGLSLEEAAELARDAGYLGETEAGGGRASEQLVARLSEELAGSPAQAAPAAERPAEARRARDQLREAVQRLGVDVATASNAQVRAALEAYQAGPRGEGRTYEQAARIEIERVMHAADGPAPHRRKAELGEASAWLVEAAASAGVDLAGMTHTMDASAVRHIRNQHGDPAKEARRGQLAVTDADILGVPSVLAAPDQVVFGGKNRRGQDLIGFLKRLDDGVVLYVEEVRVGRGELATASMRKYLPASDATRLAATLAPHAQSAPGGDIKIVEVPAGATAADPISGEGHTFSQGARGDVTFSDGEALIRLFEGRDLSTPIHEGAHVFFEELQLDAADPAADDSLRADLAATRAWLRLKDGEAIERRHHEQFARGFEAYVMEGKAPSVDLRRVFQRFRAWLVSIYRRAEVLNVRLTDPMREVYDRLLAAEDELAAAKAQLKLDPAFKSRATSMTAQEFVAYEKAVRAADEAASERMLDKAMADVRRTHTRAWKEERARVRSELAGAVDAAPDVAATAFLRRGEVKLSKSAILAFHGREKGSRVLARLPHGVYSVERGTSPEAIAPAFGYDSGDALVAALAAVERERRALRDRGDRRSVRDARLDALADARMVERHGDAMADGSLREEAFLAANDARRAEVLVAEIRYLARQAGEDEALWSETDFETWAQARVSNLKVMGLRPGVYLRAERVAGIAVQRALRKGRAREALQAKVRQTLNLHLFRAANEASRQADEARKGLSGYARAKVVVGLGPDYLDRIHGLLGRFGFPVTSDRPDPKRSFKDWVDARREDGEVIDAPPRLLDEDYRQPFDSLSVEELKALFGTVQTIAHVGKLRGRLLTGRDQRPLAEAAAEVADTILANNPHRAPETPAEGLLQPAGDLIADKLASMRKVEHLARELDGFRDQGPVWSHLYEPLSKAADAKVVELAELDRRINVLLKTHGVGGPKYALKRKRFEEIGASLSRNQLLAVALNWGAESNRQALIDSRMLGGADDIERLLMNQVTEAEWRFVQALWDLLDGYWPRIAALHREMTGVTPEQVRASPLATPFGRLRGGAYPLAFRPDAVRREGRENAVDERARRARDGRFTFASTEQGRRQQLAASDGRAVRLEISVLFEHLNDVAHDLTHRKAIHDVSLMLGERRVAEAIKATAGPAMLRQMNSWLEDVSAGEIPQISAADRLTDRIRYGIVMRKMGLNVAKTIVRPLGYSQSIARLGPRWSMVGLAEVYGDPMGPGAKSEFVFSRSSYMAHRARTFDRDLHDIQETLRGRAARGVLRGAFYPIALVDRLVALPTWVGAYEKAIHERGIGRADDQAAVDYADSVVRMTLGSGFAKDLPGVQRGDRAKRLATICQGMINTTYNLTVDEVVRVRNEGPRRLPRAALNMILISVAPALLEQLVRGLWPDGEDWEGFAAWAAGKVLGYQLGTLAGGGDLVSALSGDEKASESSEDEESLDLAYRFVRQARQGEVDRELLKSGVDLAGVTFGLPTDQLWVSGEAVWREGEGDEIPVEDFLWPPEADDPGASPP